MKKKSRKLCFVPIIFRDWSVILCEISHLMFTKEFKKQFQWRLTDAIYLWDGQKTIAYRDKGEQKRGILELVVSKVKKDKFFIADLNKKALEEVQEIDKFFNELMIKKFSSLSKKNLSRKFDDYVAKMVTIGPKLLIIQFFPMQFEKDGNLESKFRKEIDLCVETRGKWDKIVGPATDKLAIKFGTEALKRISIEKKFGKFLTIEEVKKVLSGKVSRGEVNNLNKKLQSRVKYYLLAGGKIWDVSLEDYLKKRDWELEKQVIRRDSQKGKDIKGLTCFKTKKILKGKIIIVQNKREIRKINEGDILVTPAVTPEYSPIYSNLLAIITDEGGITSHAAIVARELGIPCIIGTKIATQVLKDGDLVEVDADEGVVRILNQGTFYLGTLSDYQRMFKWKKQSFLITSFFMEHYKLLKALVTNNHEGWYSYIPKKIYKKTLEDGILLYGNKNKFNKYKNDFDKNKRSTEKKYIKINSSEHLLKTDIEKFFKTIVGNIKYYSKTEFIYTDKAYYAQSKNKTIKENFRTFGDFKAQNREFINKNFLEKDSFLNSVLNKISREFNIKNKELNFYGYKEILELFNEKKLNKTIIADRERSFVFRENDTVDGQIAEKSIEIFLKNNKSEDVVGETAVKGKIKAKARIFYYGIDEFDASKKIVESMRDGEVLVAETTSPEIMLACNKASAIVTNQGGMMSHAAIISREMKVPCIVGTGNATEKIKTGDLVEVDADEGVVRIIKRRKNTN